MKAVQIGILVVLLVCAGLLYKVYRGQQAQPAAPTAPASQPVAASTPATGAPAVTVPTPAPPAPTQAAVSEQVEPAASARRRPSPSRRAPKVAQPEQTAESSMPAADPVPAPTPAFQVLPAPAPTPTARPAVALNPPPETPEAPPEPPQPPRVTIPAGTLITVRLAEEISSDKNQPGDVFSATLDQPLVAGGFAIAERGAHVEGRIIEAQPAGRVKGVSELAVQLTKLHTSDGQDVSISTEKFVREGPTSHASDAKKVGAGAALGAIIGAIAGGGKGAAIGAGAGGAAGGGVAMATRGKPVRLPVETRLTFRLHQPVTLTERVE